MTWYVLPLAMLRTSESTVKRNITQICKSEWSGLAPSLCFYEFTVIFARTRKHVIRYNRTRLYVAAQLSEFVACKNWIRIQIILPSLVHIWYIIEKGRGVNSQLLVLTLVSFCRFCKLKAGLSFVWTNVRIRWNLVYKAFHRIRSCGNEPNFC